MDPESKNMRICAMCGFNKDNFVEMDFGEGRGESKLESPFTRHISVTMDMRTGKLSGWDSLWEQIDREDGERRRIEAEMSVHARNLAVRTASELAQSKDYIDPLCYMIEVVGKHHFCL